MTNRTKEEWRKQFVKEANMEVDPERFEEINNFMTLYRHEVLHWAYHFTHNSEDAEDLISEVKIKLYEINNGKGLLFKNTGCTGKTYVYTIMKNTWINKNAAKKIEEVPIDPAEDPNKYVSNSPSPLQNMIVEDADVTLYKTIHKCLNKLTEKERFILENHFGFNGTTLSGKEIARILGVSGARITKKREQLLKHLKKMPELSEYYYNEYRDNGYEHYNNEDGIKIASVHKK